MCTSSLNFQQIISERQCGPNHFAVPTRCDRDNPQPVTEDRDMLNNHEREHGDEAHSFEYQIVFAQYSNAQKVKRLFFSATGEGTKRMRSSITMHKL